MLLLLAEAASEARTLLQTNAILSTTTYSDNLDSHNKTSQST